MKRKQLINLISEPLERKIRDRKGDVVKIEVLEAEMYDGIIVRVVGQIYEESVIPMKKWVEAIE